MNAQIQLRRDTEANWTSENPTLASGEIGIETDTNSIKIGDGVTAWNSLAYFAGGGSYDLANAIHTSAEKITLSDDDELPMADSDDTFALKRITGFSIKEALAKYISSYSKCLIGDPINGETWDTDAAGWTLGTGWAWESDGGGGGWIRHTAGNVAPMSFPGTITEGRAYGVDLTVGGTTGNILVLLGSGYGIQTSFMVNAGTTTGDVLNNSAGTEIITITPSSDFDGYIDDLYFYAVPVVAEAPADGKMYARKYYGWYETGAPIPPKTKAFADSPYTILEADETIICDASGGAMTNVLPPATGTGKKYNIKKIDSSANAVTVDADGAETIDGATTFVISTQYESITVQDCAAGVWYII